MSEKEKTFLERMDGAVLIKKREYVMGPLWTDVYGPHMELLLYFCENGIFVVNHKNWKIFSISPVGQQTKKSYNKTLIEQRAFIMKMLKKHMEWDFKL